MHILKSLDGRPWKRFQKDKNGTISSTFTPGQSFDLVQANIDQLPASEFINALRSCKQNNHTICGNLPRNGITKNFSIRARHMTRGQVKRGCGDDDSIMPMNVDDSEFESIVSASLLRADIPENIEVISTPSSSYYLVEGERKFRLHHFIPFLEPVDQDTYANFLIACGWDERMAENNRLICTMPPTFEENIHIADYEMKDHISHREGIALDVHKFLAGHRRKPRNSSHDVYAHIHATMNNANFYEAIKNHYENLNTTFSWTDFPRLIKTCSLLLNSGKLSGRHNIHYQLLRLAHPSTTPVETVIELIANNETLLGKHSRDDLIRQAKKVRSDFMEKSRGGSIERLFLDDEIIEVYHDSLADLTDEEWNKLFIRQGVIVMKSPCNSGKGYYGVRHYAEKLDPETLISVAHRIAVGRANAELLELEYQDDLGENIEGAPKAATKRKQLYLPDADTPSILIQSSHHLTSGGKIKKRQMVVIPEIESVLEQIHVKIEDRNNKSRWTQHNIWLNNLLSLCNQADVVIVESANPSAGFTGAFLEELDGWSQMQKRLLLNHNDYIEHMMFTQVPSEAEAIATIIELIRDGKRVALCCDSGTTSDALPLDRLMKPVIEACNLQENEYKGFTSRSFSGAKRNTVQTDPYNTIPDLFDNGLMFWANTPVFDEGWQHSHDEDQYIFDAVVLISSYGLAHADKMIQWFRRFRYTQRVYAYIKHRRGRYTQAKQKAA